MKRSFPVNINGRIYNIDEDAYRLLDEYLNQLRSTFASDDEREIVEDIEARINEHFGETVSDNAIITLEDVTSVISIMGKPDELGCDIDSETNTQPDASTGTTPPPYNPGGNCLPPAFRCPNACIAVSTTRSSEAWCRESPPISAGTLCSCACL